MNRFSTALRLRLAHACCLIGLAVLPATSACGQATTPGSAVQLLGTNHMVINPAPSLALSNALTFEAWVLPQSPTCLTILSRGDGSGTSDYIFAIGYDGVSVCGNGALDLFGAGAWDFTAATNIVPLNTWTHVAVTYDGTNKLFYINGVLNTSRARAGVINQTGTPLYIGRRGSVCDCDFFQGQIDEVRIWNTVRTAAQINQNFRLSLTGTESGLVAYYRFDEGGGTTAFDSSGHANDGTLTTSSGWINSGAPMIAPWTVTTAPSNITTNSATLSGLVNPHNQATGFWFDYGLTTNYGNSTTRGLLSPTNTLLPVSGIASLQPGLVHHFRLAATNSAGTNFGLDATLTAAAAPPALSGQSTASVTSTSAVFTATLTPNGADTTAWVEYGLTTNYGSTTATLVVSGTNANPVPISRLLSGFVPGTAYHAHFLATNSAGASSAPDQIIQIPVFVPYAINFPGFDSTSAAWGDYDNDGRLDLLICGYDHATSIPATQLWRNTGNGFTNVNAGLTGILFGAVAWGDFNNDGRLDILLSGRNTNGDDVAEIWQNTGNGFSNVTSILAPGLPGLEECAVAWCDFDNDGKLDILLSGANPSGQGITEIWRNTGSGFVLFSTNLPGATYASVACGDFDNDGLPDILISGYDSNNYPLTQIWRNTGHGFTNINAGLTQLEEGVVGWGDFDNDGRLDVIISGATGTSLIAPTQVWRNTGTNFVKIADLNPMHDGSVALVDFNNDGRLDIVITGYDDSLRGPHTQFWQNTTNGFVDVTASVAPGVPNLEYGFLACADFDNDGRLDFALGGITVSNVGGAPHGIAMVQVWKNMEVTTNSTPTAPSGLSASASGSTLTLNWISSSDLETPAAGLSYNLRIGTTPGGSDVLDPMSAASGLRRVAQFGNIQGQQFQLAMPPYPPPKYYWSVQSIDGGLAGSPFAPEAQAIIRPSFTSWGRRNDGAFEAEFNITGGFTYSVQASTDLLYWDEVFSFTFGSSGPLIFTDSSATNYPRRFYRLGEH